MGLSEGLHYDKPLTWQSTGQHYKCGLLPTEVVIFNDASMSWEVPAFPAKELHDMGHRNHSAELHASSTDRYRGRDAQRGAGNYVLLQRIATFCGLDGIILIGVRLPRGDQARVIRGLHPGRKSGLRSRLNEYSLLLLTQQRSWSKASVADGGTKPSWSKVRLPVGCPA